MSWFFKSKSSESDSDSESEPESEPKSDFAVIGQSLGRQLRGVAAFLAPLPSSDTNNSNNNNDDDDDSSYTTSSPTQGLIGIRNDLVEIGGSLKSGLSVLSSNKAVSGISRLASSLLQFQNEGEEEAVSEVSDEIVAFVTEISSRPECWTDFPLALDHDFEMSDAQREHASTIQHLFPSFAALRFKLHSCSDEQFWMIYFMLLLPRLNDHDFELLSTPKIVETRDILLQKLQNKRNAQVENFENSKNLDTLQEHSEAIDAQNGNSPSQEKEAFTDIASAAEMVKIDEDKNNAEPLEEADADPGNYAGAQKHLDREEEVSFTDLEDDDNDLSGRLSGLTLAHCVTVSPVSGSSDWVKLNESSETQGGVQKLGQSTSQKNDSESEDSNEWLTVDDFD